MTQSPVSRSQTEKHAPDVVAGVGSRFVGRWYANSRLPADVFRPSAVTQRVTSRLPKRHPQLTNTHSHHLYRRSVPKRLCPAATHTPRSPRRHQTSARTIAQNLSPGPFQTNNDRAPRRHYCDPGWQHRVAEGRGGRSQADTARREEKSKVFVKEGTNYDVDETEIRLEEGGEIIRQDR